MKIFISLLAFWTLTSCNDQTQPLKTFTFESVGWTINIPNSWEISDDSTVNAKFKRGQKAINDISEEEIDLEASDYQNHLLHCSLGESNFFQSFTVSQALNDYGIKMMVEDSIKTLRQLYEEKQIDGIISEPTKENIGGIDFYSFKIEVKNKSGKTILTQHSYSQAINNNVLQIMIGYNNQKSKEELFKVWRSSKFH